MAYRYVVQAQKMPEVANGEELMKKIDTFWKYLSIQCNDLTQDIREERLSGNDVEADRLGERLNFYGSIRLRLAEILSDYYSEVELFEVDYDHDLIFSLEVDYDNLPW